MGILCCPQKTIHKNRIPWAHVDNTSKPPKLTADEKKRVRRMFNLLKEQNVTADQLAVGVYSKLFESSPELKEYFKSRNSDVVGLESTYTVNVGLHHDKEVKPGAITKDMRVKITYDFHRQFGQAAHDILEHDYGANVTNLKSDSGYLKKSVPNFDKAVYIKLLDAVDKTFFEELGWKTYRGENRTAMEKFLIIIYCTKYRDFGFKPKAF